MKTLRFLNECIFLVNKSIEVVFDTRAQALYHRTDLRDRNIQLLFLLFLWDCLFDRAQVILKNCKLEYQCLDHVFHLTILGLKLGHADVVIPLRHLLLVIW